MSASPFPTTHPPPSNDHPRAGALQTVVHPWDFAEICLDQTSAALHEARAASPAELSQAIAIARESHALGKPADLLETLARVKGHAEEHLGPVILELGNKVASTLSPSPPQIPFAGKLIAPSAFYDSFDQLHALARILLSPVVYAEDTDAIGTASVNPIASLILAEEIRTTVFKRVGIRPFITVARLDYESWTFVTKKHFEL
jgi:hypothetical protein